MIAVGTLVMLPTADLLAAAAGSPTTPYLGAPITVGMLLFWVSLALVALAGGNAWRRARTAVWLGQLPGRVGALPTEHRESHDRPRAYKVARLVLDPATGEASFLGLTLGGQYVGDDVAHCEVLEGRLPPPRRLGRRRMPPLHDSPHLACTCGFYAFTARDAALELLATRPPVSRIFGPVLVEVDLAGTVIEFDQGYRASHQRVLGVQVPRWCLPCARLGGLQPAVRLAGLAGATLEAACRSDLPQHPPLYRFAMAAHHIEVVRRLEGRAALRPVCDHHTPTVTVRGGRQAPGTVVVELADLAAALGTEVTWLDEASFQVGRFVEAVSWPPPPRDSQAV